MLIRDGVDITSEPVICLPLVVVKTESKPQPVVQEEPPPDPDSLDLSHFDK